MSGIRTVKVGVNPKGFRMIRSLVYAGLRLVKRARYEIVLCYSVPASIRVYFVFPYIVCFMLGIELLAVMRILFDCVCPVSALTGICSATPDRMRARDCNCRRTRRRPPRF